MGHPERAERLEISRFASNDHPWGEWRPSISAVRGKSRKRERNGQMYALTWRRSLCFKTRRHLLMAAVFFEPFLIIEAESLEHRQVLDREQNRVRARR